MEEGRGVCSECSSALTTAGDCPECGPPSGCASSFPVVLVLVTLALLATGVLLLFAIAYLDYLDWA